MQKLSSRSHAVAEAIGKHEEFNTHGALSARKFVGPKDALNLKRGMLAYDTHKELLESNPMYVVYSYTTPIAVVFWDNSIWRNPNKYSVTTSKHQGKLYKL